MFFNKKGLVICKKVSFYSLWIYLILAVAYVVFYFTKTSEDGRAEQWALADITQYFAFALIQGPVYFLIVRLAKGPEKDIERPLIEKRTGEEEEGSSDLEDLGMNTEDKFLAAWEDERDDEAPEEEELQNVKVRGDYYAVSFCKYHEEWNPNSVSRDPEMRKDVQNEL